ncbi:hypothetical protein ACEUKD_23610 (plasmid) [Vibrio diabolicus]|uniref:hypothetical protein n=1 Tax=Vibrio TaxID=662 RepID=UPI000D654CDF|nr:MULTISPECIES: hypothetical protein [Vibrio]MCS0376531.1 hypothetical protein [Vibrio diabolicus]PWF69509.1 hypothetical protein CBX98_19825 [Vibrio sp. T9]
MAKITPIKLCEFKRLVEHGHQLSIVAQQQASGGFSLLAIDSTTDDLKAYSVRYTRDDKPREWRLDRLAAILEESKVRRFEVRHFQ